ncbi:energy transducer TonB [Maribacter arenosus]|uniref:TonB family C-terminal domain-containing protein n=1 Tax=Maribacter arenosus TaxID=1854708 RepID=A0ABR7VCX5_9FLAO|nr:hypothetical protein [Maribacter arenosus]MBD0851513.1 hypothetical protein [Maribacter arenosus]
MHLNRQQLSLLITIFSMAIIVLGLYNIHLGGQQKEDEYVVELVLDEEVLEELIKEEEKKLEELQEQDPIKSHMAFNETAKPSFGSPEPLKTLDEILEEKAANESDEIQPYDAEDSDYAEKVKKLAKQREEKKQLLGEREAQKEERTNNLAARRTSVSYSLIGRRNYKLPPPIYTCIEGGKVVINIEVDALGNVIDASFNSKSSGTSNGCLVDNAITYALKAKFDASSKALQKGTITYLFQGK